VRAFSTAILWQKAKKFSSRSYGFNVVGEYTMRDSRDFTVHFSATKLFFSNFFFSYGLNDFGTSHEHITCILNHKDKISQGRRVNCTTSTGAHDNTNLRDYA